MWTGTDMLDIVIRTIVPLFLLMGAGFFSRRRQVLRAGDERVLSGYVYYFALPSLFVINLAETSFTPEILSFVLAGIVPVFVVLAVYLLLYLVLRLPKNILFLLILATIFGSLAFLGIPFTSLAFPQDGERLATLSAATIAITSVPISLTILELYKLRKTAKAEAVKHVARRLSRNPLILSIVLGVVLSLTGIDIPVPFSNALHMLGSTTSVVAIFMLGVFLYGREYKNMAQALKLSLLRMVFLPAVAFMITVLLGVTGVEGAVVVLMHGMPIAVSMIVLSERYDFFKETVASLILISSLGAALHLNIWLLLLSQ
jgi:predicted permease